MISDQSEAFCVFPQGYVVLNRPYAFLQWVQNHLSKIPEDYVLMSEPDHIFLKPLPLWYASQNPCACI